MTNIYIKIQVMNEAGYIFSCIDFLSPNEKYRLYMASKSVYEIFDMNKDDLLYLSKISDVPYDKLKTVRNISYPKYRYNWENNILPCSVTMRNLQLSMNRFLCRLPPQPYKMISRILFCFAWEN
jgi:hypothetical protein